MNGCNKRTYSFGISRSNAAPPFQMQERVFYKMAHFIQMLVIFSLLLTVTLGRDNNTHSGQRCFLNEFVCIITSISQQIFRREAIYQSDSLLTIRNGTCCNKYSDRHTICIHGQMYLGVEPPLVRSIAWLPPTAPAA